MISYKMLTGRLNEHYIELLENLSTIMLKNDEPFRAKAYQKAQQTIMSYPGDIASPEDLIGQTGIGSTIMDKLIEYTKQGTLKILEDEKNNPINILCDVYGIGPKKAKELVDSGIKSISDLRSNRHLLNETQKIGLHYYEDILKRIPRGEIEIYKEYFKKTSNNIKTPIKMEIVGSYRRGAQSSGDIDVIITSKNPDAFTMFVDNLISSNIIIHILSRGPTKCLVIAKISSSDVYRRVDFLYTTPEEFPFAILYFTGSKIFNTLMRQIALDNGYTMNEHGIHHIKDKKKGDKVNHIFNTESDIFKFLNLEYKEPWERIDTRAIKKIKTSITVENVELIKTMVYSFIKTGISGLNDFDESQLTQLLREANKQYYNNQPFLSDTQYDIIKEYIERRFPKNTVINEIGAPVDKNKVKLPYFMGSMNKIKPDTNALEKWLLKYKGPYIVSYKLDGLSALYTTESNTFELFSRGDGKYGQDISHLIKHLRLPKENDLVVRGELIISKKVFETKYKDKFSNARNMVSGIVNSKKLSEYVNDVRFVAYEIIKPVLKPIDQLKLLSKLNIEVVHHKILNVVNNDILSDILLEWRDNDMYNIDGAILTNDGIYERKEGNPDHAIAFKMVLTDQVAEAKVVDVLWTASKDGYLKPRVQIEPIELCGVKITYATGFNAAFIYNNKIGVGSIVKIIRSGDVIPHIEKVIYTEGIEPKMPLVPYVWTDSKVDIYLNDKDDDDTVKEKIITGFFTGIGVDGLGSGNVKRIIEAGFNTVQKIIYMTKDDFLKVDGFKEKMATKICEGIKTKLSEASLVTLMSSSNIFGRGFSDKKISLILEHYPDILFANDSYSTKLNQVSSIKGMSIKTSEPFVERMHIFNEFLNSIQLLDKFINAKKSISTIDSGHPLFGKTIVITGFRDAELQNKIISLGAKIGTSVTGKTYLVVAKDKTDETGKVLDAIKRNITILSLDEFKQFINT
jgi:DNA ligase (NAD+)